MKTFFDNLLLIGVICGLLFSCSKEEDDINLYDTTEFINIENAVYTPLEIEILNMVNDHRSDLGISSLKKLDIISSVADSHTNYMIENGIVSHNNFDKRLQFLMNNANAKSMGENVAYGYNSAQGVLNSWLKSDDHRKIIENKNYTHFGISSGFNSEGRNYYTQIFIKTE